MSHNQSGVPPITDGEEVFVSQGEPAYAHFKKPTPIPTPASEEQNPNYLKEFNKDNPLSETQKERSDYAASQRYPKPTLPSTEESGETTRAKEIEAVIIRLATDLEWLVINKAVAKILAAEIDRHLSSAAREAESMRVLREENERLKAEVVGVREGYEAYRTGILEGVDLLTDRLQKADAELATLRASASSEVWIEIKPETQLTDQTEIGRWMGQKWVISRMEGESEGWVYIAPNDFYTHYRMLNPPNRPTATNTEKSDRSQG